MSSGKKEMVSRIETKDRKLLSVLCKYCIEVEYNDFMQEARSRNKGSALESFCFFLRKFFIHSLKYICQSLGTSTSFYHLFKKRNIEATVLVMDNLKRPLLLLAKNGWMKLDEGLPSTLKYFDLCSKCMVRHRLVNTCAQTSI